MSDVIYSIKITDMITSIKLENAMKKGVKKSLDLVERMFVAKSRQKTFKNSKGKYFGERYRDITPDGLNAVFGPSVAHAIYVEKGARPSPGRYVPWLVTKSGAMGGRISTGTHPGYEGYHIMEKLREESKPKIEELVKKIIGAELKI